jgi:hypothetical protein
LGPLREASLRKRGRSFRNDDPKFPNPNLEPIVAVSPGEAWWRCAAPSAPPRTSTSCQSSIVRRCVTLLSPRPCHGSPYFPTLEALYCFLPSQVCGASHEKDKFMNTHYYKIDRPRALRSLSHFEKPVDREMCSSLRRYAACFRACVMYVNGRCSLPATALFVCGPSRNCLSGRCSATVRCRPVCSCRSSRALRVVAMRCPFV